MKTILNLMKEWQEQHDEPVDLFNQNQVKFYLSTTVGIIGS